MKLSEEIKVRVVDAANPFKKQWAIKLERCCNDGGSGCEAVPKYWDTNRVYVRNTDLEAEGNWELEHLLFDLNLDERLWNLSRFFVHVWKSGHKFLNL